MTENFRFIQIIRIINCCPQIKDGKEHKYIQYCIVKWIVAMFANAHAILWAIKLANSRYESCFPVTQRYKKLMHKSHCRTMHMHWVREVHSFVCLPLQWKGMNESRTIWKLMNLQNSVPGITNILNAKYPGNAHSHGMCPFASLSIAGKQTETALTLVLRGRPD